MAAVTEQIVREYFELLGYFVTQPRKYVVPGRAKTADEELDLVVSNPSVKQHKLPENFEWTSRDLRHVARAVVGVRGWHTDRFYAQTFQQNPDILRFVEADSIKFASKLLGSTQMARVLCLPKFPASGTLKSRTIRVLKQKGVDGVISFRTILAELVNDVDRKRNYEKSDLLQVIRILKNYDLLKDSQMELFGRKKRKPTGSGPRD